MKTKTMQATYFFHRNHSVAASIAVAVENAVRKHYPSCTMSITQNTYNNEGQALYTMFLMSENLTQQAIRDILVFTAGAIEVAKDLIK